MIRLRRFAPSRRAVLLLFGLMLFSPVATQARTIADQLERMAWDREFNINGLDKLGTESAKAGAGPLVSQVKALLSGYDHVIVHSSPDKISRLIIIGKKNSAPPPPLPLPSSSTDENVLPTRRKGDHHLVTVNMSGAGAKQLSMELMIDTGASLVVLPSSKIALLGLSADGMTQRELQTAKGKVKARIGTLEQVTLGTEQLKGVEVAFVPDELLGGNALLGMNVLGRFIFILDDDNNELTLIPDGK